MTDRNRLPNRRECYRYGFNHAGIVYTATVGIRPDSGEPMELFLHCGKAGTAIESVARDGAISASLLLQHGCGLDVLTHAMTRGEGNEAASPIAKALDILASEMPVAAIVVENAHAAGEKDFHRL